MPMMESGSDPCRLDGEQASTPRIPATTVTRNTPTTAKPITNATMVPRSCYNCNQKKIKCDRQQPVCSSCARTQGKTCVYPPLGPRIRRTKKAIMADKMADMASRLSGLEQSFASRPISHDSVTPAFIASRIESASVTSQRRSLSTSTSDEESLEQPRDDILIEKGSSSQYFNELLMSRVLREQRDVESALSTSHTGSPRASVASPFDAMGILSVAYPSHIPFSSHPPKTLAIKLWQIYVHNVEGCSDLKSLHVPTDQIKVYTVINNPAGAPLQDLALCFAIYSAAALTLEPLEAQGLLGQDKMSFIHNMKTSLEQAFAHGDFLDRPTMSGLHALAIHLSSLRVHNRGKGIWILNGLAIRIAQSLGLHRDGSKLGLPPFQAEIRRRLWWQLISRDGRAGEDYGIESTGSFMLKTDVNMPLNLDDADIYPDMKELPPSKMCWTAMTFPLVAIEYSKAILKSTASGPLSQESLYKIIDDLERRLEEFLRGCNPVIPQQLLSIQCASFLVRKLRFTFKLKWTLLESPSSREDVATDDMLVEALDVLESRLTTTDDMLAHYAWVSKAYPQYHITMYVLWHLCVKPRGPNVERAWRAVEAQFNGDLWTESTIGFGSKVAVLTALRAKASSLRDAEPASDTSGGGQGVGSGGNQANSDVPFGSLDIRVLDFVTGKDEWPEWSMSAEDLQFDGTTMFWG